MGSEENYDKLKKIDRNSTKTLPKLLKYLGKLESVGDYDDYIKKNFSVPIIEWIVQVLIIRPIPIFICLLLLGSILNTPNVVILLSLSEGISIFWFLICEFVGDMKSSWRN